MRFIFIFREKNQIFHQYRKRPAKRGVNSSRHTSAENGSKETMHTHHEANGHFRTLIFFWKEWKSVYAEWKRQCQRVRQETSRRVSGKIRRHWRFTSACSFTPFSPKGQVLDSAATNKESIAAVTTFSARPARDDEVPRENHIIRAIVTLAVIFFPQVVTASLQKLWELPPTQIMTVTFFRGYFTIVASSRSVYRVDAIMVAWCALIGDQ
jgi:hypothetical protein